MQSPGIYIKEKLARPVSLAGVSTAVPVFIGYTELAVAAPQRITGMLDFITDFGGANVPTYSVQMNVADVVESVGADLRFFLHDSLEMYFQNGGGPCFVISTGTFLDAGNGRANFEAAFAELDTLPEVTVVLVPDLHAEMQSGTGQSSEILPLADRDYLRSALLNRLGILQDKMAIFDLDATSGNVVADANQFRDGITPTLPDDLKYGAAYYPWVRKSGRPVVPLARLNLSASYAGHPLVDQVDLCRADLQAIESEYGFESSAAGCRARYQSLKADFQASTGSTKKTKFTLIFRFFYDLIAGLDHLASSTSSLGSELSGLRADPRLIRNVQHLYRIKGILDAHSSPVYLNLTGYNYPVDPAWFNLPGDTFVAGTDLETEPSLLPDYDTTVNGPSSTYIGWASADQILSDLESGGLLEMDQLFGAVGRVYSSARQKARAAEDQLVQEHPAFSAARAAVEEFMRRIPAQGAVAGLWCVNDRKFGVWRSPANLALEGLSGPISNLSNAMQDGLNVDASTGKSINAIRIFTGKGVLVWGARTLAGNSNEWRYIAVRRFFSFAEASIRGAVQSFMFAPNHARTWVQVKAVISGFLLEQWKNGALAGNTWEEAFEVSVGEGSQPDEMEVRVGMAVARPAEFITISFSQSLQNA